MNRLATFAAAAVLAAVASGTSGAQEDEGLESTTLALFRSPVLLFMPGGVTANAVSAPAGADAATGLNIRFMTAVPTATRWLTLVAGTQFQPNGLDGNKDNRPGFFYGGVVPVIPAGLTGGWLSVSLDPLGVYQPGGGGEAGRRPYGHDFFLEAAVVMHIGTKLMRNLGTFSGTGLYVLVDQQLTHLPREAGGDRDYFSPVLLYGLIVQLAPFTLPGR